MSPWPVNENNRVFVVNPYIHYIFFTILLLVVLQPEEEEVVLTKFAPAGKSMDWCRLSRAQSSTNAVVKLNGSAFDNHIMLARCHEEAEHCCFITKYL